MMLRNDTAKLFNDEIITWGELSANRKVDGKASTIKDNYMFIVTDFIVKFPDLDHQITDPDNPVYTEDSRKFEKHYKLIFFSQEQELLKQVDRFKSELKKYVTRQFVLFLLIFMLIFCFFMTKMLVELAHNTTRPIIELYELISRIVQKGKGVQAKLSYKNTNMELNKLHIKFNRIATAL